MRAGTVLLRPKQARGFSLIDVGRQHRGAGVWHGDGKLSRHAAFPTLDLAGFVEIGHPCNVSSTRKRSCSICRNEICDLEEHREGQHNEPGTEQLFPSGPPVTPIVISHSCADGLYRRSRRQMQVANFVVLIGSWQSTPKSRDNKRPRVRMTAERRIHPTFRFRAGCRSTISWKLAGLQGQLPSGLRSGIVPQKKRW